MAPVVVEDERPLILLTRPLPPSFQDGLSRRYRMLNAWEGPATEQRMARVLICSPLTPVDSAMIESLPALEYVLCMGAGFNHIDIGECRRRGIAITNSGDSLSEDVADYAVGLLLDVLRRISASDRWLRSGLWPSQGSYPLGQKLSGKRIGIVGLGSIGLEIAKRLEAFGCKIAYNSRAKKPSISLSYFSSVRDLAAESDVLITCCALTDETHHLINKDVLLALGNKGAIINVGRGALIDEEELVKCLVQGEVGGAGLDVFENEPQVPQELLSMDNVVLSPHRAALTPESFSAMLDLILINLEAFFSNKPLLSPV